jgi:hypothetical protein
MSNTPLFSPIAEEEVYIPEAPIQETTEEVTPIVEEEIPVATETIETVIADEIPVAVEVSTPPTVNETIREVEKIVEKYPEMDEYTSELFNALMEGKEDVLLNYLSEKNRNYSTMSDYDVVKANLIKANPKYTDEIAELKLERTYGELVKIDINKIDQELQPDEYADALLHNKTVDQNLKMLKVDAFDARLALEAAKKEIKLPKIAAQVAEVPKQPTEEEIAQGRAAWETTVATEVPKVKEFAWKIGDEEVSYKISDVELSNTLDIMKNLNNNTLALELGWIDKDGKQDVAKIAGDVRFLKSKQQIVSSIYSQGKTAGAKGTAANIKNLDLSNKSQTTVAPTPADIGSLGFGHLNK